MTREEAIEMVRKSWPISRNKDLRKALETLIPELRESEDERIRKEMIEAISENV
jgi:RNA binding exosome subunit